MKKLSIESMIAMQDLQQCANDTGHGKKMLEVLTEEARTHLAANKAASTVLEQMEMMERDRARHR